MTEVKREIMAHYAVDGIFINRWDGSGMCYCTHCTRNFKAATGHELPRSNDPHQPARRAYILWRQQRPIRALAALGRSSASDQSEFLRHPQYGRWCNEFLST
jgi:hypothetical protein